MPLQRKPIVRTKFKDVVVIGNGPSAITLSYFLNGNVPYYTGKSNDELLHLRLSQSNEPLVQQDLKFLSEGLVGRSNNGASLLLDALLHPEADLGIENPSLITWKHQSEFQVDHVVLGKGQPGGAWKSMEGDLLTVSLGTWMELPNLKMADWKPDVVVTDQRVNVSTVAEYYKDYVKYMNLTGNFKNDSVVTSVRKLTHTDCESLFRIKETSGKIGAEIVIDSTSDDDCDGGIYDVESEINECSYILPKDVSALDESGISSTCSASSSDELSSNKSLFFTDDSDSGRKSSSSDGGSANLFSTSPPSCKHAYFDLSISPAPSLGSYDDTDALSCTPVGIMCKERAKCRASHTCCLDFVAAYDSMCGILAWNPFVNPQLFTASSWSASATRCLDHPHGLPSARRCVTASDRSCRVSDCLPNTSHLWEVVGFQYKWIRNPTTNRLQREEHEFRYLTKNVVLAIGCCDNPNTLNVPGENLHFVMHSLKELVEKISSGELNENSVDPIMIVGAGLSAADAIIACMAKNLPILHIFRREARDRNLVFYSLPSSMYPEYHKVHRMMMGKVKNGQRYQALEKRHLVNIFEDRRVKFHGETTSEIVKVSHVLVLIGARPSTHFMDVDGDSFSTRLGIVENVPLSKNNPVDVNIYSMESVKASGLYAMGPLVRDNFVRFLQGGALAITADVLRKLETDKKLDQQKSDQRVCAQKICLNGMSGKC